MLYSHKTFESCKNDNTLKINHVNTDAPCLRIINEKLKIENNVQNWANKYKKYIILGTGGSSLSGQALKCCKKSPTRDLNFVDNIDPFTISKVISDLDLKNTGFLIISKSGETIETLAQMLIFSNLYSKENIKDHFICITENKLSTMKSICSDLSSHTIDHPNDIGGRYSVFSCVGMLPAYLLGYNIDKIISGAQSVLHDSKNANDGIEFMYNQYEKGISNAVFMSYSDKLEKFLHWIAQLYAESTAKEEKGITPIISRGTVDQHSQLQLYLGGPKDKSFSLFLENGDTDIKFPNICDNYDKLKMLNGKTLKNLFLAEANATIDCILSEKLPIRIFSTKNITDESIGALFMHFMIEVINLCEHIKINPFDQPHVERGKSLIKSYINKREN